MMSKVIGSLAVAATLALGLSTAAMADAAKAIEARETCMKANGAMMKVMVPMIKGEAAYDKAAIDDAIAKSQAACAGWADWWGEDTKPGGALKTEAKLEIWSDPKGFEAAGMEYVKAEQAVKAAADEAAFKAAFPALGKSCQSCHEKYREAD
jgi:cytochrome c556